MQVLECSILGRGAEGRDARDRRVEVESRPRAEGRALFRGCGRTPDAARDCQRGRGDDSRAVEMKDDVEDEQATLLVELGGKPVEIEKMPVPSASLPSNVPDPNMAMKHPPWKHPVPVAFF